MGSVVSSSTNTHPILKQLPISYFETIAFTDQEFEETSPQVGRMMTLAQYQKHRSDPANGPVLGPEEAATKFQEVRGAI